MLLAELANVNKNCCLNMQEKFELWLPVFNNACLLFDQQTAIGQQLVGRYFRQEVVIYR